MITTLTSYTSTGGILLQLYVVAFYYYWFGFRVWCIVRRLNVTCQKFLIEDHQNIVQFSFSTELLKKLFSYSAASRDVKAFQFHNRNYLPIFFQIKNNIFKRCYPGPTQSERLVLRTKFQPYFKKPASIKANLQLKNRTG